MDHHVKSAVTRGLRTRGIDVVTAAEDGTEAMSDPKLLDRAIALYRVIFSQDEDFLAEAVRRQRAGEPFAGVIYAHQRNITIRQCIDDLQLIAEIMEPADMANWIEYLPY